MVRCTLALGLQMFCRRDCAGEGSLTEAAFGACYLTSRGAAWRECNAVQGLLDQFGALCGGTDRGVTEFLQAERLGRGDMNRRDRELLDRQMRRFQPSPHPVGVMVLILAGVFLIGMIAGSIIFTSQQSVQTASTDGRTALAFLLSGTRSEPR